jgi:hypothetical protein
MLSDLIRPALKEMNCENKFFLKLITRSPKDHLADDDNFGKPRALNFTNDALCAILSSMRCSEDLVLLKHLDSNSIILRPYIDFHPSLEYRVFIDGKKIAGISQYYYGVKFDNIGDHEKDIREFVNSIVIPNVKLGSFVADVVVDNGKAILLEMNPWGLSDPCLFGSYNNMDGSYKVNN